MSDVIKRLTLFILLSVIIGCSGSSGSGAEAEETDVPMISTQPVNKSLPADQTAVFSVEALSGGVSYQWQHSIEGSIWNDISDATQSTYEIPAQTSVDYNWIWFRCVLTNKIGSTCSEPACLTVVTVVYVDSSQATNLPDGQSWNSAYATLQEALSNAPADLEIWVAAGTYTPGGTREDSFILKDTVDVYGGFNGDETFREARDPENNVTILSGDIGAQDYKSDNCYHVVTGANNVVLDGFTISDGNANETSGFLARGGGIFNNYTSPTISNCTFSNNSAYNYGGGMYNNNWSDPTVINCTFLNNSSQLGGGIFNYYSSPTVTNCTFSGNHTAFYGGGMYNHNFSDPTVTGCSFSDNSADNCGGGMYNYSSSPTVINCIFSGNSAYYHGGGMYNESSSSPAVTNCTFSGNSADYYGGGMYNYSSSPTITNCTFSDNSAESAGLGMFNEHNSSPTVTNCILWGNMISGDHQIYEIDTSSTTITYSCVQEGSLDNGNIADDPALNDDLTLQSDSPCIDKGNNDAVPYGTYKDLAGNERFSGYAVDMGAYEYQQ